ncbi:MAG: hypothetical protein PHE27_02580 [Alphaproteobacteria bacterium]|nr:hypothetical protein [Alphaproteobacteria bacterium]
MPFGLPLRGAGMNEGYTMVGSIGSSSTLPVAQPRTQSSLPTSRLRNTDILTAIQDSGGSSSARSAMKVFSVADAAKASSSGNSKLPRGSLIDIFA